MNQRIELLGEKQAMGNTGGDASSGRCIVGTDVRKTVTKSCVTTEMEPGDFVKKCVITKKITSRCLTSSFTEVVHFSTLETEERFKEGDEPEKAPKEKKRCHVM